MGTGNARLDLNNGQPDTPKETHDRSQKGCQPSKSSELFSMSLTDRSMAMWAARPTVAKEKRARAQKVDKNS